MENDHSHCVNRDGFKYTWFVKNLWKLSKNLEVYQYPVSNFDGLDEDCWFGDRHTPTIRKVLEHYHKIMEADYTYPIIVGEDGSIMDGLHRLCRAFLDGKETIPAVRFEKNPAPDRVENIQ